MARDAGDHTTDVYLWQELKERGGVADETQGSRILALYDLAVTAVERFHSLWKLFAYKEWDKNRKCLEPGGQSIGNWLLRCSADLIEFREELGAILTPERRDLIRRASVKSVLGSPVLKNLRFEDRLPAPGFTPVYELPVAGWESPTWIELLVYGLLKDFSSRIPFFPDEASRFTDQVRRIEVIAEAERSALVERLYFSLLNEYFCDIKVDIAKLASGLARERAAVAEYLQPVDPDHAGRNPDDLDPESRALGILAGHPDWTIKQIADAVGCSRASLYRWPKFMHAHRIFKETRASRIPRGEKDSETGQIEAREDPSE